jgi:superfamily I DNA and/or RNA helicase
MVRSRRWVLVGDGRQLPPFQEEALRSREIIEEFQLDEQELGRSLFERLADGLPEEAKAMLTTQHRMTEAVGKLISACFYDGKLVHSGPKPLAPVPGALPRPVTWLSTSGLPDHHERVDPGDHPSYVNLEEARHVLAALQRLDWFYSNSEQSDDRLDVLVIAPYRAQIAQLRRTVGRQARQLAKLSIEVNTVDAVQGREADLVVFSVTRSNAQGNLGFLNREARANVALSRAKRGLIVVGDATFCGMQPGPLGSVLQHIRLHPVECEILELRP